MNKDTAQELSDLVSSLRADMLADSFERSLLDGLSSLLRPSLLTFAYRKRDDCRAQIQLCELRAGQYCREEVSPEGFSARLGFVFQDVVASPAGPLESPSGSTNRIVMPYRLARYDCAIITSPAEHPCLCGEDLTRLYTTLELLLQARYAVKDALRELGPGNTLPAGSRHRISGIVSSIIGAAQMLLSPEYSPDDCEELRHLACRGIAELKAAIDAIAAASPSKHDSRES